jgi:hypothetical protein
MRIRAVAGAALLIAVLYYFCQYALRSAPAVMMPQLSDAYDLSVVSVASLAGLFYYGYALFSLFAGTAIDQLGARAALPAGALMAVGDRTLGWIIVCPPAGDDLRLDWPKKTGNRRRLSSAAGVPGRDPVRADQRPAAIHPWTRGWCGVRRSHARRHREQGRQPTDFEWKRNGRSQFSESDVQRDGAAGYSGGSWSDL